jgi:hypothetical protein
MKFSRFTLFLAVLLSFNLLVDARGGGRGGGGGRAAAAGRPGGVARAGNSYARTPSMSRASPARVGSPARQVSPALRNQVQARPQMQQRMQQQSSLNRSALLNQVNQNAPSRANLSQSQLNQARQNFRNNYSNVRAANGTAANQVRSAVRNNYPNYRGYFGGGFYDRLGYQPNWYTPGYNAWAYGNWGAVNGWLDWGWNDPYYYDNTGSYVEVPQEYYSQAATPTPPGTNNWMSLGVFAAAQSEKDAPYSNFFVQLVMDKSGVLSGTYYNAATDKIHPLDGFVDKDSQQAVWRVADNVNSPIMTTGIFNLTQDIADVKVRYQNGLEQYWKLVRLQ